MAYSLKIDVNTPCNSPRLPIYPKKSLSSETPINPSLNSTFSSAVNNTNNKPNMLNKTTKKQPSLIISGTALTPTSSAAIDDIDGCYDPEITSNESNVSCRSNQAIADRSSFDHINTTRSNDEIISNQSNHDDDIVGIVSEDDITESLYLHQNGYAKIKNLTDTLQGCIFVAASRFGNGEPVVIKRASKLLHKNGITIQKDKIHHIKEDIIKEYKIGEYLTQHKHCPQGIVKVIDFIATDKNYYLIMEHGGTDLFDFIVRAHELINQNKLALKEWRKFVKYLFYQMIIVVGWLHNEMHCCHLDISLENMTVQNANFILGTDGKYTIDTKIRVKFVDFGLAEFFDANHVDGFKCNKYVGKVKYKSPQVYEQKELFDARRADIWSLGVVLFCMLAGCPPYLLPSNKDKRFKDFIAKGLIANLLLNWNKLSYVKSKVLDLLKNMLNVDENKRFLSHHVIQHEWLSIYLKQYSAQRIRQKKKGN